MSDDERDEEDSTLETAHPEPGDGRGATSAFTRWLADVWDDEVEPIYAGHLWNLILEHLEMPARPQILVAGCSTGAIIPALLRAMDPPNQGRVIALEAEGPMLEKARQRVAECDRRRVFLKGESMRKLKFADRVFDVVISNMSWLDLPEPGAALREFFRVLGPGGVVALGLPLRGTLQEVYDLFAEVALKHDLPDVHRVLEQQTKHMNPDEAEARRLLEGVGFQLVSVHSRDHEISFSSGRDFFESVLVKALFQPRWATVARNHIDALVEHTRSAIDTYYAGDPFLVRLVAGCVCGVKPA
jgi:SAM-dependent methyltransferase